MCEVGRELIISTAMGGVSGAAGAALTSMIAFPVVITAGAACGAIVGCVLGLASVYDKLNEKLAETTLIALALLGLVGAAWGLVGLMGFSVAFKNAAITTVVGGTLFFVLSKLTECCEKCLTPPFPPPPKKRGIFG